MRYGFILVKVNFKQCWFKVKRLVTASGVTYKTCNQCNGSGQIKKVMNTDPIADFLTRLRNANIAGHKTVMIPMSKIKKEIIGHRQPTARLIAGEIVLDNATNSLQEYWNKNLRDKKQLVQVDSLKNFEINTNGIHVPAETTLGYKIAHNNNHMLWIDKNTYSKNEVVKALVELDIFPLLVPVNGDVNTEEEVKEFWEWLKVLEAHGIDILNQCSWGFDLKEPIYKKDIDQFNERTYLIDSHKPKEFFENLYELHQMSKQFKYINEETKIVDVNYRIVKGEKAVIGRPPENIYSIIK